jgi:ribosomal protein S18 acetylase RimI-like enzyme
MIAERSAPPRPIAEGPDTAEALEFRAIRPDLLEPLADFFETLEKAGDTAFFHPHPMTREDAKRICSLGGKDLYYSAVAGGRVLGYGMLRGWDEGYAVPSLGIAVAAECRGKGLARPFMEFLHASARCRGAPAVRLKVYSANTAAHRLYLGLGYRFEELPGGELLGRLELAR